MRKPQARAERGSQRWLQEFVEARASVLDDAIGLGSLSWLSPLRSDEYAEYRDDSFLERLGIELPMRSLRSFWPSRGPVWDGLALTASGHPVLIEAKAHLREMSSSCAAAAPESVEAIASALGETKLAFGADASRDWLKDFYQYANRLAHAYLLNELNGVRTHLVFLYFVGDSDMGGPATQDEWEVGIAAMHDVLGVSGRLPGYVLDAFVAVPRST